MDDVGTGTSKIFMLQVRLPSSSTASYVQTCHFKLLALRIFIYGDAYGEITEIGDLTSRRTHNGRGRWSHWFNMSSGRLLRNLNKNMDLERNLVGIIEEVLARYFPGFQGNRIKIYWCKKSRAKTCDLIANFTPGADIAALTNECWSEITGKIMKMSESRNALLDKCEAAASSKRLQVNMWLNRAAMTAAVLKSTLKKNNDVLGNGPLPLLPTRQALLYSPPLNFDPKSRSLTDLRSLILLEVVKRLLSSTGFEVQMLGTCAPDCETSRLTEPTHQTEFQNDLAGIESNKFGHVTCLEQIQSNKQQALSTCFLVTPHCAEIRATTAMELRRMAPDGVDILAFVTLVHGPVVWRNGNTSCGTLEELYKMQRDVVRNSFAHKYGTENVAEDDLGAMFESLADLNIKFHMLACSMPKAVSLRIDESDSTGTFVMYNYARICVLLSNFEAGVHSQLLAPLPSMEEVDFSLLKKEEEWNLVMLLAKYPKLINAIVSVLRYCCNMDSTISPPLHTIVEFASELARQISVYYSHVRVLMPAVHLKDVMFARIWLLTCTKQILEDIFGLLNVTPVRQM